MKFVELFRNEKNVEGARVHSAIPTAVLAVIHCNLLVCNSPLPPNAKQTSLSWFLGLKQNSNPYELCPKSFRLFQEMHISRENISKLQMFAVIFEGKMSRISILGLLLVMPPDRVAIVQIVCDLAKIPSEPIVTQLYEIGYRSCHDLTRRDLLKILPRSQNQRESHQISKQWFNLGEPSRCLVRQNTLCII